MDGEGGEVGRKRRECEGDGKGAFEIDLVTFGD